GATLARAQWRSPARHSRKRAVENRLAGHGTSGGRTIGDGLAWFGRGGVVHRTRPRLGDDHPRAPGTLGAGGSWRAGGRDRGAGGSEAYSSEAYSSEAYSSEAYSPAAAELPVAVERAAEPAAERLRVQARKAPEQPASAAEAAA